MKTDINHPYFSVNAPSRESLLKVNAELIENLRYRVNQRRFKAQSGDGIRLGYYRVLIAALTSFNSILRDDDLEKLQADVEELKRVIKTQSQDRRGVP